MRPVTTAANPVGDERCLCGNLVAKLTPAGVEILCPRCKRVHRIPWQQAQQSKHARDGPNAQRLHERGQRP